MNEHDKEHDLLFLHCGKCNSAAMEVRIIIGAIFFDCHDCKEKIGVMENIATDTKRLLKKGCHHNHN